MEQTYAYSAWFFTRALCVVYMIAFLSLLPQAKGLWGKQGVLPMATYMKAIEANTDSNRYWQVPSAFWLSTSDDFIVGTAITGAVFAGLALVGFAQGWSLLMCFALYLSFSSSGQDFMAFQWDALLLEVGFLALFTVPWNFDFTAGVTEEPHWLVRFMFYAVLFKLMFLSGLVKILSGDDSWRDFSAMNYHYLTQPLPNPISPFAHALPDFVHQLSVGLTFLVELILPFALFWPRARSWAALGFIGLSVTILLTGNFTFFNWLTIALCFWLIPDTYWQRLVDHLPFTLEAVPAAMFPHPMVAGVMGVMAFLSLIWCVRSALPEAVDGALQPILSIASTFRISNSYGLFATMTRSRPEVVFEGSDDGANWKEYEFKFQPGPLNRHPPFVAPFQPRLDWQLWFAALGPVQQSPWVRTLMQRLLEGSPDVASFFSLDPFPDKPPRFVRARLYNYEFTSPDEIINNDLWWKRTLLGDFTGVMARP